MAKDDLLVLDRTYELVKWFMGHLAKFPRSHRYGLGDRIERRLFDILENLILARYSADNVRREALTRTNIDLEVLRILSRLANELVFLPHKSHEYAVRELNEIGKMVGGWLKQQRQKDCSSAS